MLGLWLKAFRHSRMSYLAEVASHCSNNLNLAFSAVSHVDLRAMSVAQTDDKLPSIPAQSAEDNRCAACLFCLMTWDGDGRVPREQGGGERAGGAVWGRSER